MRTDSDVMLFVTLVLCSISGGIASVSSGIPLFHAIMVGNTIFLAGVFLLNIASRFGRATDKETP